MDLYSNISEKKHYSIGVDFIRLEGNHIVTYDDTIEEDEDINPRIVLLSLYDLEQFKKYKSNRKLLRDIKESLEELKYKPVHVNLKQIIEKVARKSKNNNIKHHPNINSLDNHHIDIITHNS